MLIPLFLLRRQIRDKHSISTDPSLYLAEDDVGLEHRNPILHKVQLQWFSTACLFLQSDPSQSRNTVNESHAWLFLTAGCL